MRADASGEARAVGDPYLPYLALIHQRLLHTSARPGLQELDGTLVFADVSGFTPLTERLARRGKIGAEELTDVLNEIFGTLLDRATEFGGDLLKFGGDALLLLFDGDGHEARACAAALAMQGALRPFRSLKTAGGTVSLRMSVGVNSGPILLLLAGTTHQELLVAGPTMSRLVELESAADAGEVLVGASTASAIDRRWLSATRKDGGTLLRRTVRVIAPAEFLGDRQPVPTPPTVPTALDGIPVGLRPHLAVRREGGEHRVAVLTFLQFKGVDALLADRGTDTVLALLHQLLTRVQEACERNGVHFLATDLDKDGGKILLAAGAPTASENDVDRSLTAVLEVLDGLPPGLTVRAGVNRGRAFAVDIGNDRRRTYAVMGDATNLAARVMGKAEAGGLLATDAVLQHAQVRYDLVALEPFLVKGKSEPIHAKGVRRIVARRPRSGRPPAASPLLGRDHECRVLARALRDARQGQGRIVELVGDPGMGASRLVEHLLSEARGMITFTVEGAYYASSSPYLALRGPLRRAFTGLDADLGDLVTLQMATTTFAPHLGPFLPLLGMLFGLELPETDETAAIDPTYRRTTLHKVAGELLRAALPEPTVVIVEDAHWLDEASAQLLSAVLSTAEEVPWAVCVSRRTGDRPLQLPPSATTLTLGPLDDDAARELVAQRNVDLPPSVVTRLVERSGGSPLFLQELVSSLQRGQDVDALPDSVEASIASRIDALEVDERNLLRHAAVLGGRFGVGLLADMLDADASATRAALRRLDTYVELREDEGRFRHSLVRECAYESLPYRRRRALHRKAGELLECVAGEMEEWSDLLSLHFAMAGDDERTWRYSRIAGDRARRAFAPVEAAVFYRRASDVGRRLPSIPSAEMGHVLETLGDCYRYSGNYVEATTAYGQARRTVEDRIRVADLHRKEGMVRERTGRFADALRWYTRGQRLLETIVSEEAASEAAERAAWVEAQLLVSAGAARLRQGRYLDCIPLLEEASTIAERVGDRETLAHAYDLLDWAHTDLGNEERHRYRDLALPIYEELGNLQRQGVVASNLGIDAYFEGRWDDAVAWYERGWAASERAGDVVQMATAMNNLGEVASDRGDLEAARRHFEAARRIWRSAPFPIGVALATSNLGRVAVRSGDLLAARDLLDEARHQFRYIGADGYVIETDVRELERRVTGGEADAAIDLAEDIRRRASRAGGLPLQLLPTDRAFAYALAQRGERDDAMAVLEQVAEQATALECTFELALTYEALARVAAAGGRGEADGYALTAAERFAELGVVRTPEVPLERSVLLV